MSRLEIFKLLKVISITMRENLKKREFEEIFKFLFYYHNER